jgi:23S rRNA (pseudouridine1915-N3)-methyltransferase
MKFRFVWVGRTKDRNWRALQEEYLSRLSHFVKCEIAEIKDGNPDSEGNRILAEVNPNALICALEPGGEPLSSHGLAEKVTDWQNKGVKEICFVIGGAEGLSRKVVENAGFSLSLSLLTFTHETARVVLLEQLYRAYTIIKGFPYQK